MSPAGRRRRRVAVALLSLVALSVAVACDSGGDRRPSPTSSRQSTTTTEPARPVGGSARVGVWGEPDPAAPTLTGAALRALVLPQLFVAGAKGEWIPSLAEPGSDRLATGATSATFRLRAGATWTDGTPITAADLRRTADARFVKAVDDPGPDGAVTVHFTQPLPGWRRLWSGTDSIAAPAPGVWGGPFSLKAHTPGLEAVLVRRAGWWGGRGPFLDELRLVLVPDAAVARELLAKGELDVVMPPAATMRTDQLESIPGVDVASVQAGGWWVGLTLHPRVGIEQRQAVLATVDRERFTKVLLAGEALRLDGLAGPEDATWATVAAGDAGAMKGHTVTLTGQAEEPMTSLLLRAMQKRARAAGGTLDLRVAEADRVEGWLAAGEYDAAVAMAWDPPGVCWTCRWSAVDSTLAAAADAGDVQAAAQLEAAVRDQALALPLWRPRTVVAWRAGLSGVRPNGWALSGAWNAWQWWRPG